MKSSEMAIMMAEILPIETLVENMAKAASVWKSNPTETNLKSLAACAVVFNVKVNLTITGRSSDTFMRDIERVEMAKDLLHDRGRSKNENV